MASGQLITAAMYVGHIQRLPYYKAVLRISRISVQLGWKLSPEERECRAFNYLGPWWSRYARTSTGYLNRSIRRDRRFCRSTAKALGFQCDMSCNTAGIRPVIQMPVQPQPSPARPARRVPGHWLLLCHTQCTLRMVIARHFCLSNNKVRLEV
jgi:hypothetical protein